MGGHSFPTHIITVIVVLVNVLSALSTPSESNPQMICGPSIGGDLAAITNYPLFCHLSICTSYHRIRQLASLLQHSIYTEYLNRWHNCPAYVSSIFREAYMLTEQRQAFLSNILSWGLNQCLAIGQIHGSFCG